MGRKEVVRGTTKQSGQECHAMKMRDADLYISVFFLFFIRSLFKAFADWRGIDVALEKGGRITNGKQGGVCACACVQSRKMFPLCRQTSSQSPV